MTFLKCYTYSKCTMKKNFFNMKYNKKKIASILTLIPLWAGLFAIFAIVDIWAAKAFAQPIMGSALVGVIEVAIFLLAVGLASPLSKLIGMLLGNIEPTPDEAKLTNNSD